ncbi:MAG: PAS domain-containing protein, partial [Nodosilinea sp.]
MTYPCCDISDRYHSPPSADNNEAQLRTIVDTLPACISYIDASLRYQFVNQTYESWFRIDCQAIVGRYVWDVIGHAAYQKAKPYVERVFEEGIKVSYETTIPYERGSRHVSGTLIPDLDASSQVRGLYALTVDISDYKHTEMQLRRSEAALAKAQEIAQIGSWEFDLASQTLDCSNEMFRLFGLSPGALPPSLPQIAQFFS